MKSDSKARHTSGQRRSAATTSAERSRKDRDTASSRIENATKRNIERERNKTTESTDLKIGERCKQARRQLLERILGEIESRQTNIVGKVAELEKKNC